MRKSFLLLALAAAMLGIFVNPTMAANYYFDLVSGNDSTGDGSAGNPWKTANKCFTSGASSPGDECRAAKKDTHTALSGTLTFTNGSTTVNTSADLTSEIAAGDYIGKNTANESWWVVSSRDASSITLTYQYWGTSETTTGYKADIFLSSSSNDLSTNNKNGTRGALYKMSGGWDLGSQTKTGKTFVQETGSTYLPNLGSSKYVEVSDFVLCSNGAGFSYVDSMHSYVHDMIFAGAGLSAESDQIFENVIISGGVETGWSSAGKNPVFLKNVRLLSPGTGIGDIGVSINNSVVFMDGVYVYNSYYGNMTLTNNAIVIGGDIILDTCRYTGEDGLSCNYSKANLKDVQIKNTIDEGISITNASEMHISDITFTNIGDEDIFAFISGTKGSFPGLYIEDFGGTANDDRIYFYAASDTTHPIIYKDSTDARSGYCLKFTPLALSDEFMLYKVGTVKITSTGSDLTLKAYMKDNAGHDGEAYLAASIQGKLVAGPEYQTLTTSYAQKSIVVDSADLELNKYIDLYIGVSGTAGSVFVDDFSYSQ